LGVAVTIDAAATQAEVAVANISTPVDGVAATGSLTLDAAAVGTQRPLELTHTVAGATSTTGTIIIGGGRELSLTTVNDTDAFNGASVVVNTVAAGNFSSITVDDVSGDITVTLEEGKLLDDIVLELANHPDFDLAAVAGGATNIANTDTGTGAFDTAGTEATTQVAAINVTATDDTISTFTFSITTAAIPPANPTATFNTGTNTIEIVIGAGGATSIESIAEAVDALAQFSATHSDPDSIGYYDPLNDTNAAGTLVPGVAAASATINLTSRATGAQVNGDTITFATGAVTSPQVSVATNGNLTVTVSNSGSTTVASIISAINAQGTYTAAAASGNTLTSYSTGVTNTTVPFSGGVTEGGGISHDVVFELLGKSGSEVFNVKAGTSINELITQINLVSDATGVSAQEDSLVQNKLLLRSTAYGSDAFVDLRVINEAALGTFRTAVGAGARDFGSDIAAKVNGVDANGKGNSLSINTASLALSLTVDAGSSADINFTIDGGGALFQLGGEVVSNQQARVGISSVSTARLGGASGRLYQLAKGETGSLGTDPNLASKIIDEAITQVTSLRGRLGAFQATTLESNLASLNETVANLTEAESSIRDADFAQESARLTRAQILIQSGTTVLGIANQSPQNVLGLLRQ
jgi:flagellin